MGIHVTIGEAEKRLAELAAAASRGEEVVLLREGQSPLRLVPFELPSSATEVDREAIRARRLAAMGAWRADFAGYDTSLAALKADRISEDDRHGRSVGSPD